MCINAHLFGGEWHQETHFIDTLYTCTKLKIRSAYNIEGLLF